MQNGPVRGIYLHIPFCARKCSYCDFYSVTVSPGAAKDFGDLLVREMDLFRDRFPEDAAAAADTVYFGGGTPTVLSPDLLCGILSAARIRFPVADGAEVTTEANPGASPAGTLAALRKAGFTRISIGVQSFSPTALGILGRIHCADDARRTHRDARSAGFDSIGFDLIFGIPGHGQGGWKEDLDRTIDCLPSHVSAYALAPEPGTPIHAAIGRGELRMPADDEMAEMYHTARRALSGAGYRQYEISNFALEGHESRHNVKYWTREGYAGLGPSAHGLLFPPREAPSGLRTANPASLAEYGLRIRGGRLPWIVRQECRTEDAWKESLIFGLRMNAGVDLSAVETRIGPPPPSLGESVSFLVRTGRLLRDGSRIRIPEHLLFVSNEILSRLA